MRFLACLAATVLICFIVPIFWHSEGTTDALQERGEILQGYVNSLDDTNWREAVPNIKTATTDLNDEIYRLREKMGEDKPWNEKPWMWLLIFGVLLYEAYKKREANGASNTLPAKPQPRPGYGPDRKPVVYMTPRKRQSLDKG